MAPAGQIIAADPTIDEVEGVFDEPLLGTLTGVPPGSTLDYCTIYWGDGTSSSGFISGSYDVKAFITYKEEGTYSITVSISYNSGANTYNLTDTADVSDPDVSVTAGASIAATEGANTGTLVVATFTDPGDPLGLNEGTSNYSADVDWGDGTGYHIGAGTIVADGSGLYEVHANYTYPDEDGVAANISVRVNHEGSTPQVVTVPVGVSDPDVVVAGVTPDLKTINGVSTGNIVLATFTDPGDPTATVEGTGDYSATIDWGDGSSTSGGAISVSGATYTVKGSHTYTDDISEPDSGTTFSITVTINHEDSNPQEVSDTADFKFPIASFSDTNYFTTQPDGVTTAIGSATITVNLTNPYDGTPVAPTETEEIHYQDCGCGTDLQSILDGTDTQGFATSNDLAVGIDGDTGDASTMEDSGADFIETHDGVLEISGASSGTFTIPILTSNSGDGNKDVLIRLISAVDATLPQGPNDTQTKAVLTIQDNSSEGVTVTDDGSGKQIDESFPGGGSITWSRDPSTEKVTSTVDQLGRTTSYAYDASGNLLRVVNALDQTTSYAYNSAGQVTSVTSPIPAGSLTAPVSQYQYDSDGRLTDVINPDSSHKDFTYDSNGNLLTEVNEDGKTTTNSYDSNNLLTSTVDPTGATTLNAYDSDGRITATTDPVGRVSSFTCAGPNSDRVCSQIKAV